MWLICEIMSTQTSIMYKPSGMTDHITDLDEDILSNILSRLPTKAAVRTCILSKAWEYKWTCLNDVDITDQSFPTLSKQEMLVKFMDRILSLSRHLRKFRLRCGESYGLSNVQRWISAAVVHNLECLRVDCPLEGTVFPGSLLNSNTLRELSVQCCRILDVAVKNCAPNLTILHLSDVEIVKGVPGTSTMVFYFPALELFTSSRCTWLDLESVKIHAPSLTQFISEGPNPHDEKDASVLIDAPQLATYFVWLGLPNKFILNGSSIVSAYLYSHDDSWDDQQARDNWLCICQLLNGFTNLEVLDLACSMVKVLKLGHRCHYKLRVLFLVGLRNIEELLELLHAAPALKVLNIDMVYEADYDYESVDSVPSCILSHLEELHFVRFESVTAHYKLLKFLLKNGGQLKKLSFRLTNPAMENEIFKRLFAFPIASAWLEIEFDHVEQSHF